MGFSKLRLKFNTETMPYSYEAVLKNKFGFEFVEWNNDGRFVVFQKDIGGGQVTQNYYDLSDLITNDLLKRLNRICDSFKDLGSNKDVAAGRCRAMASGLEAKQRAFCLDWIGRNLEGTAFAATPEDGPKNDNLQLQLLS